MLESTTCAPQTPTAFVVRRNRSLRRRNQRRIHPHLEHERKEKIVSAYRSSALREPAPSASSCAAEADSSAFPVHNAQVFYTAVSRLRSCAALQTAGSPGQTATLFGRSNRGACAQGIRFPAQPFGTTHRTRKCMFSRHAPLAPR